MVKQNYSKGIVLSLFGYSCWVASDVFVKLAGESVSLIQILTINFLVGSLIIFCISIFQGGIGQLAIRQPASHLLRSFFILTSTYGCFAGILHLALADFYAIVFTSPLLTTIFGALILKEKVQLKIWLATIFGFLGVLIAVQVWNAGEMSVSFYGLAITTFGSLSMALAIICFRVAANENNFSLSLWPQAVNGLVCLSLWSWCGRFSFDVTTISYCVIAGLFSGLGLLFSNASLRLAPVAIVSPYHYVQIIVGALMGYLIWGSVPTVFLMVGAIMIILSGIYIARSNREKSL